MLQACLLASRRLRKAWIRSCQTSVGLHPLHKHTTTSAPTPPDAIFQLTPLGHPGGRRLPTTPQLHHRHAQEAHRDPPKFDGARRTTHSVTGQEALIQKSGRGLPRPGWPSKAPMPVHVDVFYLHHQQLRPSTCASMCLTRMPHSPPPRRQGTTSVPR